MTHRLNLVIVLCLVTRTYVNAVDMSIGSCCCSINSYFGCKNIERIYKFFTAFGQYLFTCSSDSYC